MKTFRTAILIAGILVAGLAFNTVAQSTESLRDPDTNERAFRTKNFKHDKPAAKVHIKGMKQHHKSHLKASHKSEMKEHKGRYKSHKAVAKHHKTKL